MPHHHLFFFQIVRTANETSRTGRLTAVSWDETTQLQSRLQNLAVVKDQNVHSVISIQRRALASCHVAAVICARLELIKRRESTRCFVKLETFSPLKTLFFFLSLSLSFSYCSPCSSVSAALTQIFFPAGGLHSCRFSSVWARPGGHADSPPRWGNTTSPSDNVFINVVIVLQDDIYVFLLFKKS